MFFIALVENPEIKSPNFDGLMLKIYYGYQLEVITGAFVLLQNYCTQLG